MIKQVCSIFFRNGQKYFGVGNVNGKAKKFLLLELQHNFCSRKKELHQLLDKQCKEVFTLAPSEFPRLSDCNDLVDSIEKPTFCSNDCLR